MTSFSRPCQARMAIQRMSATGLCRHGYSFDINHSKASMRITFRANRGGPAVIWNSDVCSRSFQVMKGRMRLLLITFYRNEIERCRWSHCVQLVMTEFSLSPKSGQLPGISRSDGRGHDHRNKQCLLGFWPCKSVHSEGSD